MVGGRSPGLFDEADAIQATVGRVPIASRTAWREPSRLAHFISSCTSTTVNLVAAAAALGTEPPTDHFLFRGTIPGSICNLRPLPPGRPTDYRKERSGQRQPLRRTRPSSTAKHSASPLCTLGSLLPLCASFDSRRQHLDRCLGSDSCQTRTTCGSRDVSHTCRTSPSPMHPVQDGAESSRSAYRPLPGAVKPGSRRR